MSDIIALLPDNIANQIAAGEVIQRPASAVKELVENAIDSGATSIKLIIKDAGKTLIEIVDNGCGMSETDARMSFERHATSKIKSAQDLFSIRTMGFRGEALASIAAIAQVELFTRRKIDELGTHLKIESSKIVSQEVCQTPSGTRIRIKNLFYSVPARRKFLKSDTVEMKNIIDEFQRAALANADIFMSLHHNGKEIYHLPSSNLRQRVRNVLGNQNNKKLIPLNESTDVVSIKGFIGKPEFAKKNRGEQFLFVNNRFIKSPYLQHAITQAYEGIIAEDKSPLFTIFLDIAPDRIDINVHPTKHEIKFEDGPLIYNLLKVTVRHALGQFSLSPTFDFDADPTILDTNKSHLVESEQMGGVSTIPSKANFTKESYSPPSKTPREENNLKNWQTLYADMGSPSEDTSIASSIGTTTEEEENLLIETTLSGSKSPYQIHNRYIVSPIKSGFLLIDQHAAHERILYEKLLNATEDQSLNTQKMLFPEVIQFNAADALIAEDLISHINKLGFEVEPFGHNTFIIQGVPASLTFAVEPKTLIMDLINQFRDGHEPELNVNAQICHALAKNGAIKKGKPMEPEEMTALIEKLFACLSPYSSPSGKKCFITYTLEDLHKEFDKI